MIRTFRFPLRPTAQQEVALGGIVWACRDLYNAALQQRIDVYRQQKKSLSKYDQQKEITKLRAEDTRFADIATDILRSSTSRLDGAFQAFFRRNRSGETPGYPRFKGRDRYNSFSFSKPFIDNNRVRIPKLGLVKFHLYRPITGTPLSCSVRQTALGWTLSIVCAIGEAPSKIEPKSITGIDVGLTSFAVLSNGDVKENPRFFRRGETLLAARQRRLSRKKRGSTSRGAAKRLVAKAHAKVRNQRLDHARKLANDLVNQYDVVAFEDLNIKGMIEKQFAKSIHDAAWGIFISCLISKAEYAGKWAVGVNPKGTTQRCSGCDVVVPKGIADREHNCPHCGLCLSRDHNAAINIKTLGLSVLSREWMKVLLLTEASL